MTFRMIGSSLSQSAYREATGCLQVSCRASLKVKERIFRRERRNKLINLGSLRMPLEAAKELGALGLVSLVLVPVERNTEWVNPSMTKYFHQFFTVS